jgi:hypothetical protein
MSLDRLTKLTGIRDRLIEVLTSRGVWEPLGSVNVLVARIGKLEILHRSPFQKLHLESERTRYLRALSKGKANLPYGLDVWHQGKKVLNLEWDDEGQFEVIAYKPGEWEMLHLAIPRTAENSTT